MWKIGILISGEPSYKVNYKIYNVYSYNSLVSGAALTEPAGLTSAVRPDFVQVIAAESEYFVPLLIAEMHAEDSVDMQQLQDPLLQKLIAAVLSVVQVLELEMLGDLDLIPTQR